MAEPVDLNQEHNRLIRKLESIADLTDEEKAAVFGLPMHIRQIGADQDIVREGDRPSECCLVVDGFACSYKHTDEGRRQIMSFYVPGDIPDLQSLHLATLDHNIGSLVPCKLAFIPHASLHHVTQKYPRLGAAFWRDTLIDGAVFREWIMNVGRRDARARMAHLLCELWARLKAVGLATDTSFQLELTQAELGDALGLSTVHVNRVLQELRGSGLVTSQGRTITINDKEALERIGEFDATYLHLTKKQAA